MAVMCSGCGVTGGQPGGLRVQAHADFEDVFLGVVLVHALRGAGNLAGCPHISAVAAADFQHAAVRQRLDGLAQGAPGHAQGGHQLRLGGDLLLQRPFTGMDHPAELVRDFVGQYGPVRRR